ncbi:MAG TPA: PadR family transcriptional regulator [Stellaceae bacterium]|nr:PadR family transcriptional regulator [Stellaceae bacterium]
MHHTHRLPWGHFGRWAHWVAGGHERGGHRGAGRGGFGGFGGFMGGMGRGGGGFRTGRKMSATDLQLVILALLAEQPRHGYELIKALEDRSGGFYAPSPGVIYPALTYLEEIGHATVEAEGAKKLYRISAEGQGHLAKNRETAEAILAELERIGAKMAHVRRIFSGEASEEDEEAAGYGRRGFGGQGSELHTARHALRSALHAKHHCDAEEAKRIAAILRRAAAEILGQP